MKLDLTRLPAGCVSLMATPKHKTRSCGFIDASFAGGAQYKYGCGGIFAGGDVFSAFANTLLIRSLNFAPRAPPGSFTVPAFLMVPARSRDFVEVLGSTKAP